MATLILFLLSLVCEPAPPPPAAPAARPTRTRQIVRMDVTAYCLRSRTATGTRGHIGTCAGPRHLIGKRVRVAGWPYQVTDYCPAGHIDLWMPTRAECRAWGRRRLTIEIEVQP